MTDLAAHYRGDTFVYSFTLGNGWVGADFTGGVTWTLRTGLPGAGVTDDSDAVDQATVDGGEITFDGATGTIRIPDDRTTLWPTGRLVWDLQGVVTGPPKTVVTLDSGGIIIRQDATRTA